VRRSPFSPVLFLRLLAAGAVAAVALTGCGKDTPSSPPAAGSGGCEVQVGGAAGSKPTVTVPHCNPPTQLVTKDVIAGTGTPVAAGQTATVQYVGISWSTGSQFDASWDSGQPFPVANLGQAQVITGWNEGLIGMKQGGRRLLVIPPDKGYGDQAQGPIKANETLVFVVDLVQISG
jgi:peptidylprolyl isomerase